MLAAAIAKAEKSPVDAGTTRARDAASAKSSSPCSPCRAPTLHDDAEAAAEEERIRAELSTPRDGERPRLARRRRRARRRPPHCLRRGRRLRPAASPHIPRRPLRRRSEAAVRERAAASMTIRRTRPQAALAMSRCEVGIPSLREPRPQAALRAHSPSPSTTTTTTTTTTAWCRSTTSAHGWVRRRAQPLGQGPLTQRARTATRPRSTPPRAGDGWTPWAAAARRRRLCFGLGGGGGFMDDEDDMDVDMPPRDFAGGGGAARASPLR